MPGFKFELSQLVMVPGKNQQGRISGRMEFVNEETVYQIKWLDDDLNVYTAMFKEGEVVEAQRRPSDVSTLQVKIEADTEQFHQNIKRAIGSLEELNAAASNGPAADLIKAGLPRRKRLLRKSTARRPRKPAKRKARG